MFLPGNYNRDLNLPPFLHSKILPITQPTFQTPPMHESKFDPQSYCSVLRAPHHGPMLWHSQLTVLYCFTHDQTVGPGAREWV